MFLIYETIVLFVIFDNSVHDCYEIIGNYTDFNENSCGISRFSPQPIKCFEWHKDVSPALYGGRDSLPNEAPWTVLLVLKPKEQDIEYCAGTLITDQWVLTSVDCILDNKGEPIRSISIYMNPEIPKILDMEDSEYIMFRSFPHHLYNKGVKGPIQYSLGLIKMNKPYDSKNRTKNTICLPPKKGFQQIGTEYAMVSGWDTNRLRDERRVRLQLNYMTVQSSWSLPSPQKADDILNEFPNAQINQGKDDVKEFIIPGIIVGVKSENQLVCKGDAGSPVWQYYLGRAVLIGVVVIKGTADYTRCYQHIEIPLTPTETIRDPKVVSLMPWIPISMDWVESYVKKFS